MPAGLVQKAKRAYVKVLLSLASKYEITAGINRDSDEKALSLCFRKLARRTHPDKGGCDAAAKLLHVARDEWRAAQKRSESPKEPQTAAPSSTTLANPLASQKAARKAYRIQSEGVMLTYQGIRDFAMWLRFVQFVEGMIKAWGVKHWGATWEMCPETNSLHTHLYLQFFSAVDRTVAAFAFEGVKPNASTNDYLGDGLCRKRLQESMDRGFFYVCADKIGSMRDMSDQPCVVGNYMPCWTRCRKKHRAVHEA